MFRVRIRFGDDADEDFSGEETEQEWEDACCEDPYWDDEEEDNEREWCD